MIIFNTLSQVLDCSLLHSIIILEYVYLFDRRFACVFITFKATGEIFGHDDAGGGIFSWLFQTTTILLRDGVSWDKTKLLVISLPIKYFTTQDNDW